MKPTRVAVRQRSERTGRERSGRIGSDRIESIGREDKPQNEELIDDSRLKPFFDPIARSVRPSVRRERTRRKKIKKRTEPNRFRRREPNAARSVARE